jgi:hypothetical protein
MGTTGSSPRPVTRTWQQWAATKRLPPHASLFVFCLAGVSAVTVSEGEAGETLPANDRRGGSFRTGSYIWVKRPGHSKTWARSPLHPPLRPPALIPLIGLKRTTKKTGPLPELSALGTRASLWRENEDGCMHGDRSGARTVIQQRRHTLSSLSACRSWRAGGSLSMALGRWSYWLVKPRAVSQM